MRLSGLAYGPGPAGAPAVVKYGARLIGPVSPEPMYFDAPPVEVVFDDAGLPPGTYAAEIAALDAAGAPVGPVWRSNGLPHPESSLPPVAPDLAVVVRPNLRPKLKRRTTDRSKVVEITCWKSAVVTVNGEIQR